MKHRLRIFNLDTKRTFYEDFVDEDLLEQRSSVLASVYGDLITLTSFMLKTEEPPPLSADQELAIEQALESARQDCANAYESVMNQGGQFPSGPRFF